MNKQHLTKRIIMFFMIATCFSLTLSIVGAETTVELDPTNPKPQETISFTATITDVDNIEKVTIRVQECGNEPGIGYICYTEEFNETMDESDLNMYTASVTLKQENAIELKYEINYLTGDGWISYPEGSNNLVTVDLDTSTQTNDGSNNDETSDTPGFEFMFMLFSIAGLIGISWFRKKHD